MSSWQLSLQNRLKPYGWVFGELVFNSPGVGPDSIGADFTLRLLRPETGLLEIVWREGQKKRYVRVRATRSQQFIRLADLLEPFGLFPSRVTSGVDSLGSLPTKITEEENIPLYQGAGPRELRWTLGEESHSIKFETV